MGGGADMVQIPDRRRVIPGGPQGPPQEELVHAARPGVRISAHQVHVSGLEIRRGEDLSRQEGAPQVGDLGAQPADDPVRVPLRRFRVPPAVGRRDDLALCVAQEMSVFR